MNLTFASDFGNKHKALTHCIKHLLIDCNLAFSIFVNILRVWRKTDSSLQTEIKHRVLCKKYSSIFIHVCIVSFYFLNLLLFSGNFVFIFQHLFWWKLFSMWFSSGFELLFNMMPWLIFLDQLFKPVSIIINAPLI